ncbi:DNA primase, partial [bacterium]|nr:DNA primase [bacterium]
MPSFSAQFLDRVRLANPVDAVIGQHVKLRKAGRNLLGLCPFHHEKTPSFTVSPEKGFFHCFGCKKSGNVFQFLMEYEGVGFIEAVETLAQRAGIPLENAEAAAAGARYETQRRATQDRLYNVCQFAEQFFQQQLLAAGAGVAARQYLAERQVSDEAVRAFRIGFAPDAWDALTSAARAAGHADADLLAAGLAIRSESGQGLYDRFRNRLMFPIWDVQGRTVAFGGRVIVKEEPKYLNSPETPVYTKGKVLYPVNLTKRAIQQKGAAILCEGYMDAVALAQNRITNIVASCGTALTSDQALLLKRFAPKVIVAYDGDSAGEEGAVRSISVLLEQGIDVFVAGLAGGEDPDSFLRKNGPAAFQKILDDARPFFPYLLDRLSARFDLRTPQGRYSLCEQVFPVIARIDSEMVRNGYLDELSAFIKVDRERVAREFARLAAGGARKASPRQAAPAAAPPSPAEEAFLAIILRDENALRYAIDSLDSKYLRHDMARATYRRVQEMIRDGAWQGIELFIGQVPEEQASAITEMLCRVPESGDAWKEALDQCIRKLHAQSLDEEIAAKRAKLNETNDAAAMQALVKEIASLQQYKRDIASSLPGT